MPLPVAPFVALGAAKAISGGIGAIGQHQEATARARAQNQAAMNQYGQRLKIRDQEWKQTQQRYATELGVYDRTLRENTAAASLAYGRQQQQLNDVYARQNVGLQNMAINLAMRGGAAAASGKTGRSAGRLDANMVGQYARNQGLMADNLMRSRLSMAQAQMDTQRLLTSANNRAYDRVAIAPQQTVAPLVPTQVSGPSNMSLFAGLGNAALEGVQAGIGAYSSLS